MGLKIKTSLTVPTISSEEGIYYVKTAEGSFDTYVVRANKVNKQVTGGALPTNLVFNDGTNTGALDISQADSINISANNDVNISSKNNFLIVSEADTNITTIGGVDITAQNRIVMETSGAGNIQISTEDGIATYNGHEIATVDNSMIVGVLEW